MLSQDIAIHRLLSSLTTLVGNSSANSERVDAGVSPPADVLLPHRWPTGCHLWSLGMTPPQCVDGAREGPLAGSSILPLVAYTTSRTEW